MHGASNFTHDFVQAGLPHGFCHRANIFKSAIRVLQDPPDRGEPKLQRIVRSFHHRARSKTALATTVNTLPAAPRGNPVAPRIAATRAAMFGRAKAPNQVSLASGFREFKWRRNESWWRSQRERRET